MRSSLRVGLVSLTGLIFSALPLAAQRISGEVVLAQGPVAARIEVRDRPVYYSPIYRRPRREVILERREVVYAPRVIVVERRHFPHGRARGWWRKEGFQRAIVWIDVDGRYYDHDYRRDYEHDYRRDSDREYDRRPLRPVTVYERDGQYYDWDD
jgi:hypothetical protein